MNKAWHISHRMPKNPTLEQRLKWHSEHSQHCGCRPVPTSLRDQLDHKEQAINPYLWGSQFLKYCVSQGWLRQEGSGGRGTRWYPTGKGKTILKKRFGLDT